MSWSDRVSVNLGASGPVRVSTDGADPGYVAPPFLGFTPAAPTPEDEQRQEFYDRLHNCDHLVLTRDREGRPLLVGFERLCIAEADPDDWGDQA